MEILVNELHKPARRHYPRRSVVILGLHDLWQADLVEMIPYARQNEGFKYLLTVINCMSKFAWAIPLKNKSGEAVTEAFETILKTTTPPANLQTDSGGEFHNRYFKLLMKRYNINHYSTYSEKKASIVERFNRSLKTLMWKQFSRQGNYKWLSILKKILQIYNTKIHSTTGKRPKDFTIGDEPLFLLKRHKTTKAIDRREKFKIGDSVRISLVKGAFAKGFLQNYTNEVFTISKVLKTSPVTYILKDHFQEELKGSFYEQELQKTRVPDLFLVEKVIKRRKGKGGKLEHFVKWHGLDSKFNSWVDNLEDLS